MAALAKEDGCLPKFHVPTPHVVDPALTIQPTEVPKMQQHGWISKMWKQVEK